MEREEIACVAASYGVDFDQGKDVKMDIIKKLEKARDTGRGLLMITDERNNGDDDGDKNDSDSDTWLKVTKTVLCILIRIIQCKLLYYCEVRKPSIY